MSSPQTVHPPQCIAPKAAGNQIRNGSFESNGGYASQVFTYWVVTGNWDAVDLAHGYVVHSGSWTAYGGNFLYVDNGLSQTLAYPVPVSTITAFGFYATISIAGDNVTATIYYSDGTSTTTPPRPVGAAWFYNDLTPYLTAGKTVTGLKIVDLGTVVTDAQIDDVVLTGIAASPTGPRLFYSPQST